VAIERMKRITLLFPARDGEAVEEWLFDRGVLHLERCDGEFARLSGAGGPLCIDCQEAAERLAWIRDLLAEAEAVAPAKKSFLDAMLPVKAVVSAGEMESALRGVDLKGLHGRVKEKTAERKGLLARMHHLEHERGLLGEFSFVAAPLSRLKGLRRTFCIVFDGDAARVENLARDAEASALLAWQIRRREGERIVLAGAGLAADAARCAGILRAHGFHVRDYPEFDGVAAERLAGIEAEKAAVREGLAGCDRAIRELLAPDTVRMLRCLKGHWESEKRRGERASAMVCSRKVGVARGYVREADARGLASSVEEAFPGAGVALADPEPSESVPVSIRLGRWARPGQLLISMFGLPNYFTFDPTPFLLAVFLAFFGICFADVVYGLLLSWCSWRLMRRYAAQENIREFFRLFLYCGASCILFGVVTGSWAADIYSADYLGKDNAFLRFVQATTLIDMLAKPVVALVLSLGIGVATQFYGILLRAMKDWRQGNVAGALFDGVLWLVYLGGLLVFAVSAIGGAGGSLLTRVSGGLVVLSAAGLVLTQGRDQEGWPARIVTGLVSLYGILGSYGTTSFVGDVLSYSRLLALGLNTYIVGMSFNIIATIVPEIVTSVFPALGGAMSAWWCGGVLVVLVMIAGHLFNFVMSILSAFVHSARLILLEFFGRFYQGDGRWFEPHGFSSESVQLGG